MPSSCRVACVGILVLNAGSDTTRRIPSMAMIRMSAMEGGVFCCVLQHRSFIAKRSSRNARLGCSFYFFTPLQGSRLKPPHPPTHSARAQKSVQEFAMGTWENDELPSYRHDAGYAQVRRSKRSAMVSPSSYPLRTALRSWHIIHWPTDCLFCVSAAESMVRQLMSPRSSWSSLS